MEHVQVKLKIYQLLVADLVGSLETQYTNCKFASRSVCGMVCSHETCVCV